MTPQVVPEHLPRRLSICCYIWSWITSATPGEPYGDLETACAGLGPRGFNCVRADVGLNWCFTLDGKPRGEMEFGPWIRGHGQNLRTVNSEGGGRHKVLERVLRLLELARKYDFYVISTSWEYQDSTWLVADPAIRREVMEYSLNDRFMHMARQHDRLLTLIKQEGLEDRIAFAEVHNEPEYSDFPQGPEGARQHREALAFLRERHPDLLITGDFSSHDTAIVPENTQLYDQHMYAGAGLAFEFYRQTVDHPEFDPQHPRRLPLVDWLLRDEFTPWDEYMTQAENVRPAWRARHWLYDNLDNDRHDYWWYRHFGEWEPQLRARAAELFAADAAEARRRGGLPQVVDEGGYFYPPLGSRFEESAAGRLYFEYLCDLAMEHGYWGFMPTTYCGPEQPLWKENPEWLKKVNKRFVES
jgi:hypothetical protein